MMKYSLISLTFLVSMAAAMEPNILTFETKGVLDEKKVLVVTVSLDKKRKTSLYKDSDIEKINPIHKKRQRLVLEKNEFPTVPENEQKEKEIMPSNQPTAPGCSDQSNENTANGLAYRGPYQTLIESFLLERQQGFGTDQLLPEKLNSRDLVEVYLWYQRIYYSHITALIKCNNRCTIPECKLGGPEK